MSTDLENHIEEIRAADGALLRTRGSGTIDYCPKTDTNLLALGALEAKGLQFTAKHALLKIQDPDGDTVFQARRHGNVYPLLQPTPVACHRRSQQKAYYLATAKPASRERWHKWKHHRLHSRIPHTQRAKLPGERLHWDLFCGGDSLLGVGNIGYEAKNQWRIFDGTKVWIRLFLMSLALHTSQTGLLKQWGRMFPLISNN